MREIKYVVLHCTATSPFAKVEAIQNYWKNNLGWKMPGYHYVISANGGVKQLATEDQVTNGVAGYNAHSIHISYIGGIDGAGKPEDTRTPAQKEAQIKLLKTLRAKYPKAAIMGHRDFPGVKKACPSFNVESWLKTVNIQ